MTPKLYSETITADGTYVFPKLNPGREYIIEIRATGTGTVAFGYDNGAVVFTPFRDASGAALSLTGNGGFRVTMPASGKPAVTITAAASLILSLVATPVE